MLKGKMIIDGRVVRFQQDAGITVAMAAEDAGIYIPRLCSCEDLHIKGNCRVCMVEISGRQRLIPACSTLAVDGLVVETQSPMAISHRRTVVELILADHKRNCPSCSGNTECQLQRIADDLNIICEDFEEVFVSKQPQTIPGVMTIHRDRCIRCGRCKAFCEEKMGIHGINLYNRGWESEYRMHFDPVSKSGCVMCGRCTQVCPVGCLNRDSHLDRVWSAVDGDKTTAVIFFDENVDKLVQSLEEECGYIKEKVCGFLKKIGVDWVFSARDLQVSGDKDKGILMGELASRGVERTGIDDLKIIGITSDTGYKYLVEDIETGVFLQAVLVPKDVNLLIKQALLDMGYIEPKKVLDI